MITQAAESLESSALDLEGHWKDRTEAGKRKLDKTLRDLQPGGVDGTEYLELIGERDRLIPKRSEKDRLSAELGRLRRHRSELLVRREERRDEDIRLLERAARRVSNKMAGTLRVTVQKVHDYAAIDSLLRREVGGRLDRVLPALREAPHFTPRGFCEILRAGATSLVEAYSIPYAQAEKIATLSLDGALELEEILPRAVPTIELNLSTREAPVWRPVESLSTGQKATALLILLLQHEEPPLLVDQPEDDLDNGFISNGVVPRLQDEKSRRQMIFSSHNANIPVLADADLIIGMQTVADAAGVHAELPAANCGALDSPPIKELVEDILEGGQDAFLHRRYLYGF